MDFQRHKGELSPYEKGLPARYIKVSMSALKREAALSRKRSSLPRAWENYEFTECWADQK